MFGEPQLVAAVFLGDNKKKSAAGSSQPDANDEAPTPPAPRQPAGQSIRAAMEETQKLELRYHALAVQKKFFTADPPADDDGALAGPGRREARGSRPRQVLVRHRPKLLCETVQGLLTFKQMRGFAETVDMQNETPLFAAAQVHAWRARACVTEGQHGHIGVVRYLLQVCMVDVNTARHDGATPLFIAANNNHLDVVMFMVNEAGANTDLSRSDGRMPCPGVLDKSSPLKIAHHNGHTEVVKFLMGK